MSFLENEIDVGNKPEYTQNQGPVNIENGKIIGKRYKIIKKLGEGGCGAVYKCLNIDNGKYYALKAESNFVTGGTVLKLEAQIMKKLKGKICNIRMVASGKKEKYCYIVMNLLGKNLSDLHNLCGKFTLSTLIRVAIQCLHAIKQVHEIGVVHRDVKPANFAIGSNGISVKMIHILDFGLAREYTIMKNGKLEHRVGRDGALFRGTVKYCSINTHLRCEQGRCDDLWSLMYLLGEFIKILPWEDYCDDKETTLKLKKTTKEETLFPGYDNFTSITTYLKTLNYYSKPDYGNIAQVFLKYMKDNNVKYTDPYDWETKKFLEKKDNFSDDDTSISNKKDKNKKDINKKDKKKQNVISKHATSTLESVEYDFADVFSLPNFENTDMKF
ncbi:Asator [Strongyloides ratti]|uniref:Asator n=1 Tax=Strongyloides ratti TaxID=34506 RepID=A0A090MXV0_STRRB|nr:Asator [Strongyloides ratti]CEF66069.1 Asator [Strongyloides ratti]